MYIYVLVQDKDSYYRDGAGGGKIKTRLEQASGERCLVVPYEEFNMETVKELNPRAITMSGFGNHFQTYSIESFYGMYDVLHQVEIPVICFCGSHQLLGFSYNLDFHNTPRLEDEPMRLLDPQEDLPRRARNNPKYDMSRYYVADGFFPIKKVKDDPLFEGLSDNMIMRCSHYCEVKKLPYNFEILARSGHCRIEAMKHKTKIIYGTQFHPEAYDEPYYDGKTLLENFSKIVCRFWDTRY